MQYHAKGSHVSKLNSDWIWPPSAREGAEEPPPEPPVIPSGPQLLASADVANMNSVVLLTGGLKAVGQTINLQITGRPKLTSIKLHCELFPNTLDQPFHVKLHAWTSGYGPTNLLAEADPVSLLSLPAGDLVEFVFSGANQYLLDRGQDYLIAIELDAPTGNEALGIALGSCGGSVYMRGAAAYTADGIGWSTMTPKDLIFSIYGELELP